ncbi:MAG: enolase C-terminal domain-like protein [Nocardioidaceae bacterium]
MVLHGSAGVGEFSPFLEYDDHESAAWLAAALEAANLGFPEPVRRSVDVNCTVPAVSPDEAVAIVTALSRLPHRQGQGGGAGTRPSTTTSHASRRCAAALGASGRVRVDANGGWSVERGRDQAINALAEFDLEYVEQPTRTVEELREVRGLGRHTSSLPTSRFGGRPTRCE